MPKFCSNLRCAEFSRPGQGYCASCHAAYKKTWNKTHKPSEEARNRAKVRSYAQRCQRKGLLKQQDCEDCGSSESQKHHENYLKPLEITWLCVPCHRLRQQVKRMVIQRQALREASAALAPFLSESDHDYHNFLKTNR